MSIHQFRRLAAASILGAMAWTSPALSQGQSVTLQDLRFDLGFGTVTIPRLEVQGTPLSEAELRAVLDPAASGDVAQRLSRLEARSARAPQVIFENTSREARSRVVYSDVVVGGVRAGVIGEVSAASASGEAGDARSVATRFRIGAMRADAVDIPAAARALTGSTPNPAQTPLVPLYRTVSYADYVMELPGGMGEVRIARVTGRDAKARPGREPLLGSIRTLMELAERQQGTGRNAAPTSSQDMVFLGQFFGLVDNFEYGVMDMEGMTGAIGVGAERATFRLGGMRFSDQAANAGFAMRDFAVEAGPARFVIAEVEARDFSFRSSFRAASELLQSGNPRALERDWRKLIPQLGSIRIAGVDLVAPEPSAGANRRQERPQPPSEPAAPLRISARSLELGFGGQLEGVPTALRFGGEELAFSLPASSTDANVRNLRAMGITQLNLGWLADLVWRQDRNALDIQSLDLTARDLFSVKLSGRLGNVTREAFSTDAALAQVAWLQATAQQVKLSLQNSGLFEKIIENEARKARKSADQLRREWGSLSAIALPAILGDSEGAKTLAGAISRFIARPGSLEIDIASRQPSGIGLADGIAAANNPQSIFEKLDVKAQAR